MGSLRRVTLTNGHPPYALKALTGVLQDELSSVSVHQCGSSVLQAAAPRGYLYDIQKIIFFRCLDPDSLNNAFQTCTSWNEICRGDPVLRMRIRQRILQIRERKRRVLLDPSAGVVVERVEPTTMFQRNNKHLKKVSVARNFVTEVPKWLPKIDKHRTAGPIRRKRDARNAPYKNLRL
ncbi:hypothetical protein WA026_019546 [Henosepilachna vigintioctopunctata]|uniref:F-box domain-containing protein n=1 Tax=Henosepilachna vigintioctopunctata TaxID=420089 RepID=A0AAW1TPL5_9CUCU